MNTLQENIYPVGPQASGGSFWGRFDDIADVGTIFSSVSSIHLVGPTRFGKSSLVGKVFEKNKDYPHRLCVQISMAECEDAFAFWSTLSYELYEQLHIKELWNADLERYYNKIDSIVSSDSHWFMHFKLSLQSVFNQIRASGFRLVLSIDEFDAVINVFGDNPHYFMLLRSIYSEPKFATSGVIISRRRLQLLEAECQNLSTYHGVFREKTLHAFNDDDMADFYESLELYGIKLSSGGRKKLERYTGRIPYLCCMFAERMVMTLSSNRPDTVSIGDSEINGIFKECLPQVEQYYDDLVKRLEYDNHLEIICYLSLTSRFPSSISNRDIENLKAMGVIISEDKDGVAKYFAYSKDFMTSFRLRPLKLPVWETMTQSEKRIKALIKREYPELDTVTYDDLIADTGNGIIKDLNTKYSELNLNSGKIKHYCEDLSSHKEHPTILDVLTLSETVSIILSAWEKRFHKYFLGDDSWKIKLEYIKDLRNPVAHAAIDYISPDELSVCMQYCSDILHLKY